MKQEECAIKENSKQSEINTRQPLKQKHTELERNGKVQACLGKSPRYMSKGGHTKGHIRKGDQK